MAIQSYSDSSRGLQHYDDTLNLTGESYRLYNNNISVDVIFGMLDVRTGHMPINLINGRREYWENTIYYDANRRQVDVYDPNRWQLFVETYVGGNLTLGFLSGFGTFLRSLLIDLPLTILAEMQSYLIIMLFMGGFIGLIFWAFFGYVLFQFALQAFPYIIAVTVAWGFLYVITSYEHNIKRRRVAKELESLIASELAPVLQ